VAFDFTAAEAWSNDWAWGLPLVALTVLVHAFSLVVIRDRVVLELPLLLRARRSEFVLALLMIVTVLLLTVLHAVEASAWAGAYVLLGARADFASAMLYSLSAMTMAVDGGDRGAERHAPVRPVDSVPVRRASRALADETAPIGRVHKFTRTNDYSGLAALLRNFFESSRCDCEERRDEAIQ
jgi:hypothetical protein